jgi:hypothetical protein
VRPRANRLEKLFSVCCRGAFRESGSCFVWLIWPLIQPRLNNDLADPVNL